MLDVQVKAAETVKEMDISEAVTVNPNDAHLNELRRRMAAMTDEDVEVALEVLITRYPFTAMDIIKDYFKDMKTDLGKLRGVFIERDARKKDILGDK